MVLDYLSLTTLQASLTHRKPFIDKELWNDHNIITRVESASWGNFITEQEQELSVHLDTYTLCTFTLSIKPVEILQ